MKATDLLTQQHRKVTAALEKILAANGGRAALMEVAGDSRRTWPSSRSSSIPRCTPWIPTS